MDKFGYSYHEGLFVDICNNTECFVWDIFLDEYRQAVCTAKMVNLLKSFFHRGYNICFFLVSMLQ